MKIDEKGLKSIKSNKIMGFVKLNNVLLEEIGIEEYDEVVGDVDGHTFKTFYRVNSDVFSTVFEEIKNNPNCSFVTPYNEVVKEGLIPEKVSVLIKETEFANEERIASQILNFYELPTPVNIAGMGQEIFSDEVGEEKDEEDSLKMYTISLDFIGGNARLEDFTEENRYAFFWDFDESFQQVSRHIVRLVNTGVFKNLPNERKNQIVDKLMEDFAMSYLVRKFIFIDTDLNDSNIGMLVDESTKEASIINFDFELAFGGTCNMYDLRRFATQVIEKFPHIWEKFVRKSRELLNTLKTADEKTKVRVFPALSTYFEIEKSLENILAYKEEIKIMDSPQGDLNKSSKQEGYDKTK